MSKCAAWGHKMEVNEEPLTPERRQGIRVGDTVHVYNGTSSGTRAYRQMAYIGTVVGYDELAMKWLVCVVFYLVLSCLVCVVLFGRVILFNLFTPPLLCLFNRPRRVPSTNNK
jgi:hypothetical protein